MLLARLLIIHIIIYFEFTQYFFKKTISVVRVDERWRFACHFIRTKRTRKSKCERENQSPIPFRFVQIRATTDDHKPLSQREAARIRAGNS